MLATLALMAAVTVGSVAAAVLVAFAPPPPDTRTHPDEETTR